MADEVKAPAKKPTTPAPKPAAPAAEKKECVVTRTQFRTKAPAAVQLNPAPVLVKKEFESGTMGYYGQVSFVVDIDGVPTKMNGQCQLFIANSKDAKE